MKNKWEKPRCNFCGNDKSEIIWRGINAWIADGKYQIVRCRNCSLVYLSPRPKKAYILKYYPPETYWGMDLVNPKKAKRVMARSKDYDYLYRQILSKKKTGDILDLGAGTGLFLSKFKRWGWNTNGVELSKNACSYAKRAYKLNLINGSFPEVKLPVKIYDVITFNGCLEHLYMPKESLAKVYNLLKSNGFVEINVPNFDSLGRLIFGRRWYALQPPTHLYHFTPKTITKMMTEIGFNDIEIKHDYRDTNRYILFESFRLALSPKYQGNAVGNFVKNTQTDIHSKFSFKIGVGKILAKSFSVILASLETFMKRGEVITIYAKKY